MAGTYSEVDIVAPSSAVAGETVSVEARIRNLHSFTIHLTATMGRVDGTVLRFGAIHKWVGAGETESWYDSFIMPGADVVLSVESWYKGTDDVWYSDDRAEQAIALLVTYQGTISKKELEYDGNRAGIPVY